MKKGLQSIVYKEGNQYVSQCLNVDVASFGDTKKQAIENLKEALELYFEDLPRKKRLSKITQPELVAL